MNVMQQTQLQETAADSATLHAPGNDWYRRRSRALSIARTDAGTFLTELESSLAAVNLEIKAVLDDEFRPTPQHVAAVRQLAMLDNTMATYNRSTSGPIQAGALFMRWLAAKGGARVRVAPTVVQDEGDVRLLQFDEQRGRTNVTRMHTRGAVVETFVRLCVQGARPVQKHEHATCTVVAVAKTPAMHGVVQNVLEPLPAMALHYKLSDSLEAPRGFKLFQVQVQVAEHSNNPSHLHFPFRASSRAAVAGVLSIASRRIGASNTLLDLRFRAPTSTRASTKATA